MRIKDKDKYSRPREKLEKYGAKKLSEKELMAIVLSTGIKGKNAVQLSKEVIDIIYNHIDSEKGSLDEFSEDLLKDIKGLEK